MSTIYRHRYPEFQVTGPIHQPEGIKKSHLRPYSPTVAQAEESTFIARQIVIILTDFYSAAEGQIDDHPSDADDELDEATVQIMAERAQRIEQTKQKRISK